jgi:hypothetical protein
MKTQNQFCRTVISDDLWRSGYQTAGLNCQQIAAFRGKRGHYLFPEIQLFIVGIGVSATTADEVCARVSVFLTTPDEAERSAAASWLSSWQSSPSSYPVALRLVRQSFDLNVVFWPTKAMEIHLTTSPDSIDEIFLAMRTRAHSVLCPPNAKCLTAFLGCLLLASLLRPTYVNCWRECHPDLQVPYLGALFDRAAECHDQSPVLNSLVRLAVFPLLATAPMTRDWLGLARHSIRFLTEDYSPFEMLFGRFETIPDHRETFSECIAFCGELHSQDFLNASDLDRAFIGHTMEVLLDVADRLLDDESDVCEMQMAALVSRRSSTTPTTFCSRRARLPTGRSAS